MLYNPPMVVVSLKWGSGLILLVSFSRVRALGRDAVHIGGAWEASAGSARELVHATHTAQSPPTACITKGILIVKLVREDIKATNPRCGSTTALRKQKRRSVGLEADLSAFVCSTPSDA